MHLKLTLLTSTDLAQVLGLLSCVSCVLKIICQQVQAVQHLPSHLCVAAREADVIPSVRHHARAQILHSGARRVRHGGLEGAGGLHANAKRVRRLDVSPSATELSLPVQRRFLLLFLPLGLLLARPNAQGPDSNEKKLL